MFGRDSLENISKAMENRDYSVELDIETNRNSYTLIVGEKLTKGEAEALRDRWDGTIKSELNNTMDTFLRVHEVDGDYTRIRKSSIEALTVRVAGGDI